MKVSFTWDDNKAANNIQKHGVAFEEARSVFDNPLAVTFNDPLHSESEPREIIVGHSTKGRLLMVCFVERSSKIRIISARCATKKERKDYEEYIEK